MDPENEEQGIVEEEQVVEEATPVKQEAITKPEARYMPYHQAEEIGIVDTETNTLVGTDIFIILSKILNELDEIKKSQG